jgi:hypothetical protein
MREALVLYGPWFRHPDGRMVDARDLPKEKEPVRVVNVMCGSCKATGVKHVWNTEALLVPTDPPTPCPSCNGTGMAIKQT